MTPNELNDMIAQRSVFGPLPFEVQIRDQIPVFKPQIQLSVLEELKAQYEAIRKKEQEIEGDWI